MKIQKRLKVLALVLLLLMLPIQGMANPLLFERMGIVAPKESKPAPEFSLKNIRGGTTQLSDFKGKIVLINFWATWCAACIEEMASMQNLYGSLQKQGVEIVAISIDRWNEDRIIEYADKNKLSFHILRDPDQIVRKQYYVMGLPTSYLIDGEGKIRGYASGARSWDSSASQNALLSLKDGGALAAAGLITEKLTMHTGVHLPAKN
ncbi:MAG: TlpA family protein disulfide reductase [Nitrospinae bacterium]|nr:TlpA family protein disulfide reductase [Nitrospinota bacterium]